MGQDIEKGYNEDYNVRWVAIPSDDESQQNEMSKWAKGIESTLEIIFDACICHALYDNASVYGHHRLLSTNAKHAIT